MLVREVMLLLVGAFRASSLCDSAERIAFDDNDMIILFVPLLQKLHISSISFHCVLVYRMQHWFAHLISITLFLIAHSERVPICL